MAESQSATFIGFKANNSDSPGKRDSIVSESPSTTFTGLKAHKSDSSVNSGIRPKPIQAAHRVPIDYAP